MVVSDPRVGVEEEGEEVGAVGVVPRPWAQVVGLLGGSHVIHLRCLRGVCRLESEPRVRRSRHVAGGLSLALSCSVRDWE